MKQSIIGSVEQVEVPVHGSMIIPAKVDTGADNSSIWVSDIVNGEGLLSFVFFGPGSDFYTGKRRQVKRFKMTLVKNSFGHSEVRYKIWLTVKVGDNKSAGWFSLADRSSNTYPMLLVKSFLKNKFVVDVSLNNVHGQQDEQKRVLVTSYAPKVLEPFLSEVQESIGGDVTVDSTSFSNLLFDINGLKTDVYDTKNDLLSLSEYDLTYIKTHWKQPELASALAQYLDYKKRPYVDREVGNYASRSKLSEMMKLTSQSIPVPRSYIGGVDTLIKNRKLIIDNLQFPLILKNVASDKGKNNYYIENEQTFVKQLELSDASDIFVAQLYVPNEGYYRLNIFGSEVAMGVYRSSVTNDNPLKRHLNKPAGSANANLLELDKVPVDALELAVRAAFCMNRQIAGVDILQNKDTKEWYVLEVNNSPQIRTGPFLEEKKKAFANYIERRLNK